MLDVIANPGALFDEVKTAPGCAANWLAPAVMLILVSWISGWLVLSQDPIQAKLRETAEQAADKQIERMHQTGAQAEQARAMMIRISLISIKGGVAFIPVVVAFATPFWGGLIVWLVGTKVFKGQFPYMKAVEVAGLANVIASLEAVVRTMLVIGLGNFFASPSLMLLVKGFNPQNPIHGALGAINAVAFWGLAVRALGLARLSGVSFAKAAAWGFGIWAALMGIFVGFGLLMQSLAARVH